MDTIRWLLYLLLFNLPKRISLTSQPNGDYGRKGILWTWVQFSQADIPKRYHINYSVLKFNYIFYKRRISWGYWNCTSVGRIVSSFINISIRNNKSTSVVMWTVYVKPVLFFRRAYSVSCNVLHKSTAIWPGLGQ